MRDASYPRYVVTEKKIGETPLVALEKLRTKEGIPSDVPLAYAGRLDPMAEGKLLILIGEECKRQTRYHSLDKEYEVKVLLGVASDSGDVLGMTKECEDKKLYDEESVKKILQKLEGTMTLPYPHFSSKTVKGKPLHVWTLEGRLNEIEIPTKECTIYRLLFKSLTTITKEELLASVRKKIESIPRVTDPRKALGEDFRRDTVRAAWKDIEENGDAAYQLISLTCTASSGSYMRSLAERIAKELGTCGLAHSIHRTEIGRYLPLPFRMGIWTTKYR